MNVIAKAVLIAFWIEHPDAEAPLQAWYRIIERTSFKDFNDLRATFAGTDAVDGLTVFDFGGNPYRLIAALHYNRRKIYVRAAHAGYNRGRRKEKRSKR